MRFPETLRDKRGMIRLPSREMFFGTHPHMLPYRNHPLLPEHRDHQPRGWREIVREDPCSWCGKSAGADATAEHVVTRAAGGSDHWDNLVGACYQCNHERGAATVLQYLAKRACLDKLKGRRVGLATLHELVRARRVQHRHRR